MEAVPVGTYSEALLDAVMEPGSGGNILRQ